MKTNAVPAVIMLTAGLLDCILSLYEHMSFFQFTKRLLIVLVAFYILGCAVKIVLDMNFKDEEEQEETEQEDMQEEEGVLPEEGQEEEPDSMEEPEEAQTNPDLSETE